MWDAQKIPFMASRKLVDQHGVKSDYPAKFGENLLHVEFYISKEFVVN
jgi:hypothetical protein